MTGLAARLRPRPRPQAPRASRTAGGLLAQFGRAVLWLLVAVLLWRGVEATLVPEKPTAAIDTPTATIRAWPDDTARAFAVEFATAYLTHAPGEDAGAYMRRVEAYASPELAGQLAPNFDRSAAAVSVHAATAARVVQLDGEHALITVGATLMTRGGPAARWLDVPIARDARGGLVVDDLPALVATPPRAAAGPVQGDPLLGSDSEAITDVVARFLRAYVAGDPGALSYLSAPGARVAATAGGLQLLGVESITQTGRMSSRQQGVLANVRVRDLETRASCELRYRVLVVKRDRWYVASVDGGQR